VCNSSTVAVTLTGVDRKKEEKQEIYTKHEDNKIGRSGDQESKTVRETVG
jgi:hypothetical protein